MNYMTQEDKERLEQQLKVLVDRRVELSDRIGRARELGDLKENAEYHAAKEDQGHDDENLPEGLVFIGSTIILRDIDTGSEDLYKLVGELTGSIDVDYIEVTPQSPMGMALFKAEIGSKIRVDLPRGKKHFEILEAK